EVELVGKRQGVSMDELSGQTSRLKGSTREQSPWTAAHGFWHSRDMTIKRLDHVSVVVDDLAAAIAFFTALGMALEAEMPVEGPWVDRVNGLESVQVDI